MYFRHCNATLFSKSQYSSVINTATVSGSFIIQEMLTPNAFSFKQAGAIDKPAGSGK